MERQKKLELMRQLQAAEQEKTNPRMLWEMRMKLAVEIALVLNLKKEVEKLKDKAGQESALNRELRAMTASLWQQVDNFTIVNLALKEEARRKSEETQVALSAAAH